MSYSSAKKSLIPYWTHYFYFKCHCKYHALYLSNHRTFYPLVLVALVWKQQSREKDKYIILYLWCISSVDSWLLWEYFSTMRFFFQSFNFVHVCSEIWNKDTFIDWFLVLYICFIRDMVKFKAYYFTHFIFSWEWFYATLHLRIIYVNNVC